MDVQQIIGRIVAETGVPGAVAIVGDVRGTLGHGAAGLNDIAAARPMATDTIFQIASMTKALTSVAALILHERGQLDLDAAVAAHLPALADPDVLAGFTDDGAPILRKARRPITARHLLTHTSGLAYDFGSPDLLRARGPAGPPAPATLESLIGPLMHEPGEGWTYGTNTDWLGLLIEQIDGRALDRFIAEEITVPLQMPDTGFALIEGGRDRLATLHARDATGGFAPMQLWMGGGRDAEFISGGGGLFSTAADYMRFMRMLLGGGALEGARILSDSSMALLTTNQIGSLSAGRMESALPMFSLPVHWYPKMPARWSLAFLINPEDVPGARRAGSLAWAGIANCYYWVDPVSGIAAALFMQYLPFADPAALAAYDAFEKAVYAAR